MRKSIVILVSCLIFSVLYAELRTVASEMAHAASSFLASLTPEQRRATTFPLQDEERFKWHFYPRMWRQGMAFRNMASAQSALAHALLATGLSREGYQKAVNIMYLEQILYNMGDDPAWRDPSAFFFTVFGEPSETGDWGWRVEGHHLSLNFTLSRGKVVSMTPSFWGASPAVVKQGPHAGLRVLAQEELLARELVRSFQGSSAEKVLIAKQTPDETDGDSDTFVGGLITGASRQATPGPPVGVAVPEMSKSQAELLTRLIEVCAFRLRPELAEAKLAKLRESGWEKIHFAWAGEMEPGQPHYYRVQGPTFAIEYDNTQDGANHIHMVWRDLENDFGLDPLRKHYAESHHHSSRLTGNKGD